MQHLGISFIYSSKWDESNNDTNVNLYKSLPDNESHLIEIHPPVP